jgi:hypothetical protein
MADAGIPVVCCLAWTSNWLEVNNRVVTKDDFLSHDIKMIAVSVFVGTTNLWAPLLIAIVRAEIGNHDDNTFACVSSRTTGWIAWRASC